ncbi:patatin-like phospholipase family protein [Neptunicella marina]|uniref:Patatin-like phospholipase family protein n=1 Tax=Neptunicella marina TaxID=2125989 RepID=A0A8J6LWR7_9ALTE|nr:patatin-like phospholipase family protein [Neptunicella marina]MBC3764330.1 patatin-like phospholipase family protein [Neptunicella marina]
MSVLDIYAGPAALKRIREEGFHPDLFDFMLGASGGPKWFVLSGIDRIMVSDFFAGRSTPLDVVGSSAGSFRFSCYTQQNPQQAIDNLAYHYSHTVYSDKPTTHEISQKAWQLLEEVLGDDGARQIAHNKLIRAHFIVARCLGLTESENKAKQLTGLLASAAANKLSRKLLKHFYHRVIFSASGHALEFKDPYKIPTEQQWITEQNCQQALVASGAIPLILKGVQDITGANPGMYRDGGIIDYHFDLQLISNQNGLVLYPHFFKYPAPGWFDKSSKRKVHASSYDNVVMLVPSDNFIQQLPYNKIPDRKDFETMTADIRIPYWQEVIKRSEQLGEALCQMKLQRDISAMVKPIGFC